MMNAESNNTQEQRQGEKPLCLRCMRPMDPLTYYCPHCGEATGQLTPYIPFVNIRWQTQIWGNVWRQAWSDEISLPGRLLRLVVIVFYAPVLFVGVLFRPWRHTKPTELSDVADNEDRHGGPNV